MSRVFDSTLANYIEAPASPVYANLANWSMACWIFLTAIPENETPFLGKNPNETGNMFALFTGSDTTLNAYANGYNAFSQSIEQIPLGVWTHLAFSWDGTSGLISLFMNGVECTYATQNAWPGPLTTDDSTFGFDMGGSDDGLLTTTCTLAEAVVWNDVLTQPQIAAVAASTTGVPPSPALVGYWHLCGTASPEPDASGNGNNGALSVPPPTKGPSSPGFNCNPAPPVSNGPIAQQSEVRKVAVFAFNADGTLSPVSSI